MNQTRELRLQTSDGHRGNETNARKVLGESVNTRRGGRIREPARQSMQHSTCCTQALHVWVR
eukprot:5595202-Amphidinium_carterae.1